MSNPIKIGIVICDRYRRCAGGKCLRALRNREGAFSLYDGRDVELVGYTTCAGCPGGNVEYLGDEMVRNGVQAIHLATGMLVGYPPCPNIETFKRFLEGRYGIEVVVGTHPIPQNYLDAHTALGSWGGPEWPAFLAPALADEAMRRTYD